MVTTIYLRLVQEEDVLLVQEETIPKTNLVYPEETLIAPLLGSGQEAMGPKKGLRRLSMPKSHAKRAPMVEHTGN